MASTTAVGTERAAKRTKYDYLESITVIVGEDKKEFAVHKNIVCGTSDFFRAATGGRWKEAIDKRVSLPDTTPSIFAIYLGWLYMGKVDNSADGEPGKEGTLSPLQVERVLIDTYALGDFLQDRRFKNAVVDDARTIIEVRNAQFNIRNVECLWEKLARDSGFVRMMVDYIAFDLKAGIFKQLVGQYPHDLVVAIATICVQDAELEREHRKPRHRPRCHYHEHRDERDSCQ